MSDSIPTVLRAAARPTVRPRHRLATRVTLAALIAAGVATGCAACSDPPVPVLDSVGRLDSSPALVAVQVRDGNVTAYVCDGDSGLGERFSGPVRDGVADLRTEDGATLHVNLAGDGADGTFTQVGQAPARFVTAAAHAPDAGWYTAALPAGPSGPAYAASWIELDDGTQNGLVDDRPEPDGKPGKHHGKKHGHKAPRLDNIAKGERNGGGRSVEKPGGKSVEKPGGKSVEKPEDTSGPRAGTGIVRPRVDDTTDSRRRIPIDVDVHPGEGGLGRGIAGFPKEPRVVDPRDEPLRAAELEQRELRDRERLAEIAGDRRLGVGERAAGGPLDEARLAETEDHRLIEPARVLP